MKNAILGALCAISVFALLSMRAPPARTGDFTCINPNAIRSFWLSGTAASYTVPADKSFMITDVVGVSTIGPIISLRVNGNPVLSVPKWMYEFNVGGGGGTLYNQTFLPLNLVSGIPVPPGSVITEASGMTVTVCGYEY